jgi:hypothetical protein
MPEIEPATAKRTAENALQVGSVDTVKGRAKALLIVTAIAHLMGCNPAAAPPVSIYQLGRLRRKGADRVEYANAPQLSVRVGR